MKDFFNADLSKQDKIIFDAITKEIPIAKNI